MLQRSLLLAATWTAVLLTSHPAASQTAAEYYDENCANCHTIGQGNINGGPDLDGVTRRRDRRWLVRLLLDPDDLTSDPVVARMIKDADGLEMPETEGLTRAMAEALLDFIEQRSSAGAGPAALTPVAPATAEDVARGRELFTGRIRLASAGPACVHCHDASALGASAGGRIGPDLTLAIERLGGTRGTTGWLRTAPTPMMRSIYHSTSISADESRAIAAFLEHAAAQPLVAGWRGVVPLIGGSLALAAAVLGVIGWSGARRFRGVRRTLVAARGAGPSGSTR